MQRNSEVGFLSLAFKGHNLAPALLMPRSCHGPHSPLYSSLVSHPPSAPHVSSCHRALAQTLAWNSPLSFSPDHFSTSQPALHLGEPSGTPPAPSIL